MRGTIVGSLALALGILVAGARGEDIQWRAAAPAPAGQQGPAVTLRPPGGNSAAVQQVSYNTSAVDGGWVPTSQTNDPPLQPQAFTPVTQEEKGPTPNPIMNMPSGSPGPMGGVIVPQPMGMPGDNGTMVTPGCGCGNHSSFFGGLADCGLPGCDWIGNHCCGGCGDCCNCCDCCDGCCAPRSCFWVRGEYLLWTVKSAPLPPLVTQNNAGNNPTIGSPGTQIVYGGDSQGLDMRSGGRVTIGFGLPCTDNKLGFETTFFMLADRSTSTTFSSTGTPSLGRPFIDAADVPSTFNPFLTNPVLSQYAELVAFPGVVSGSVNIRTSNELWGVEENLRYPILCGCDWKVDFLAGFRYWQLTEGLDITENLVSTGQNQSGTVIIPGTGLPGTFVVMDSFNTRNEFYGGQIGIDAEWRWWRMFFGGTGKLAMGDMHQVVAINGSTAINTGGTTTTYPGGLLALPTNIGQQSRDTFAVLPELGLRVGFYFTDRLRAYVGYDVMYASSVVRPGDQIDTTVNRTYLPQFPLPPQGAAVPAPQFHTTDFWAQGVSFGLEWRY